MTARDQVKLIDQGFRIIRADYFRMAIKEKYKQYYWRVLEKDFKTKTDLERRIKELLKDQKTVEC